MPSFATDNAIVTALGMIAMVLVFAFDFATHNKKSEGPAGETPNRTYLDYPSLRSAYWYFFGALACVLIGYCLLAIDDKAQDWPEQIKALLHPVIHVLKAVASNIANLSVLIAALAYGRGSEFDRGNARTWLFIYAILIALWATCWELFHHAASLFLTLILIAPDVLFVNVALILLGWVFFSRWSGVGTLYFIITALYALLQLPARLALDLNNFFEQHGTQASNANLEPVFYLLAVGKIFLIGGFILLVRTVTDDIVEPRAWPKQQRNSPYPVRDGVVALVLAFVAAAVVEFGRQAVAGVLPRGLLPG